MKLKILFVFTYFNKPPFSSRIQIGTDEYIQQCISVPVKEKQIPGSHPIYYLPFTDNIFKPTVTPKAINVQDLDILYQISGKKKLQNNIRKSKKKVLKKV